MAFDSVGNLYVADSGFETIRQYSGAGSLANANYITGLSGPQAIAFVSFSPKNMMLVVDTGFNTVRQYFGTGPLGIGQHVLNNADFAPGLSDPADIAISQEGAVYVVDRGFNTVREYDSLGRLVDADFAPGLSNPLAIAIDGQSNVYVADVDFNTVRVYDSDGVLINSDFAPGLAVPISMAFVDLHAFEIKLMCDPQVTHLGLNLPFFHRNGDRIENQDLTDVPTCPTNLNGVVFLSEVPNGIDMGIIADVNGQGVPTRFCNLDNLNEPPNFNISFDIDPNTGEVFCSKGTNSIATLSLVPLGFTPPPPPRDVGGEFIPIETTSLILAGSQSFSWMIPVILSGIGIGLFVVSRKSE